MAETCLASITPPPTTSTTSLFTTTKTQHYPILSLPSKPLKKLSLSLKPTSKFSLLHRFIIPLVAQTSDWAPQQEEEENESEPEELLVGSEETVAFGSADVRESEEESYPEPPEEAKLYVGNLPFDVHSEQLAELFNQAGVVEIAEVIYNRETDQSRGFGFVTMSTVEEAEKAVELFHRYVCIEKVKIFQHGDSGYCAIDEYRTWVPQDLNGRLLNVNKAARRGSRPEQPPVFEPSYRIYVGNLPWQVDDGRLEQVFSEHGKVVNAKVVYDRETGRSRGFGFVTMSSETELNDAIAALDGQSLDGRAIRVNVAEQRSRRGSF